MFQYEDTVKIDFRQTPVEGVFLVTHCGEIYRILNYRYQNCVCSDVLIAVQEFAIANSFKRLTIVDDRDAVDVWIGDNTDCFVSTYTSILWGIEISERLSLATSPNSTWVCVEAACDGLPNQYFRID